MHWHAQREITKQQKVVNSAHCPTACSAPEEVQPVRNFFEDFVADMAQSGTYVAHIAMMKPWMNALGLNTGPVSPPVRDIHAKRAQWLVGCLKELRVA